MRDKQFCCELCGITFTKRSNLNRHLGEVHNLEVEKDVSEKKYKCLWCQKEYATRFSFARHKKQFHPESLKTSTVKISQQKKFQCESCGWLFFKPSAMNRHMEKVHNEKPSSDVSPKLACPHCDDYCKTYQEFNEHLTNQHDVKIDIENIDFNSMEDFHIWKALEESETLSRFIRRTVSKNHCYYVCQRSGVTHKSQNPKTARSKRSVKTGKHCPAAMKLKEDDKGIHVVYQKTHTGHTQSYEFAYMSTKMKRAYLAGRVKDGIPYDRFKRPIIEPLRLGKRKRRILVPEANDVEKRDISEFHMETCGDSKVPIVGYEVIYEENYQGADNPEIDSVPLENPKSGKERLMEIMEKLKDLVNCIPKEYLSTMINEAEILLKNVERLSQVNRRKE